MIIKKPVNKPRWFGLTGIGGGGSLPEYGDPSTQPPGDKIIQNYGTDEIDIELNSLGEGVFLVQPRYDYYLDLVTPSNPYGDKPAGNYEWQSGGDYRSNATATSKYVGTEDRYRYIEFTTNKHSGPIFKKVNSNKPSKNQFFISPFIDVGRSIAGIPKPGQIISEAYNIPTPTEKLLYPLTFVFDVIKEPLGFGEYRSRLDKVSTYSLSDTFNQAQIKNVYFANRLPEIETPMLNVNMPANLHPPYDYYAHPSMGRSALTFDTVGWIKPGSANGDYNSPYNPDDWELEKVVEREPTKGYTIYKVLYKDRPATFEECIPFRTGGLVSGAPGINTGWSGYWACMIYTG